MINPRPARSTATVVFTWWLVLTFLSVFYRPENLPGALARCGVIIWQVLTGAALGLVGITIMVWLGRSSARRMVRGHEVRGMKCNVGEVPFLVKEPRSSSALPDPSIYLNVPADFFQKWMDEHREKHPHHVALLHKLLRVFEAYKDLPATHVPDGHGGRTLQQHSALCAYLMHVVAQSWEWKGYLNKNKAGKVKVILQLRDANYRFDPSDPMAVIIGLAHDIGKIESYIYDSGAIVGTRHEHDMAGARMLGRMPEVWDLPVEDQFAMMMAVAHYHRPMDLPLLPDRRAIDDRTIALMELLIRVDGQASAVETKGRMLTQEEEDQAMLTSEDTGIAVTEERIWEEICILLGEPARIDSRDTKSNIGSYCQVVGANTPLLVLHEESLRMVLATRFRVDPDAKLGDGRAKLTLQILRALHVNQALRTSMKCSNNGNQYRHYTPESAIWQVGFWKSGKAKAGKAQFDRISGWVGIIVDPAAFDGLRTRLTPYTWSALVEDGVWRGSRALKAPYSAGDVEPADAGMPSAHVATDTAELQPDRTTSSPGDGGLPTSSEVPTMDCAHVSEVNSDASLVAPIDQPSGANSIPEPGSDAGSESDLSPTIAAEWPSSAADGHSSQTGVNEGGGVCHGGSEDTVLDTDEPPCQTPETADRTDAVACAVDELSSEPSTGPAEVVAHATAPQTTPQSASAQGYTTQDAGVPEELAPVAPPVLSEPQRDREDPAEAGEPEPQDPKQRTSRLKVRKANNELMLRKAFAGQTKKRQKVPMDSIATIRRMLINARNDASARGIQVTSAPDGTFALTSEQIDLLAPGIDVAALGAAAELHAQKPQTGLIFQWLSDERTSFVLGLRGERSD